MAGRFSVEAAFKAVDNYSRVVAGITNSTEKMLRRVEGGMARVNAFNGKVLDGMKAVGTAGLAAGAVAGAGLLHVVKTGAEFEHAITGVGAVMGKTRAQIQDLEQAATKLGIATQFSPTEVADAMEQMARKGFDAEEILRGIPGVLDAVAASGEGMAEVSTVVGSTLRGFGIDASNASHVADVLAFSAEKTGAHITDMGVALANAAPTAKALGVSLEDTAASVGLLQKMGIDASTAGTAVATMLAKITKPSKEAAQQMAAMGIKFQDAHKNALPFRDILGQFVKAGDKAGGNMGRMAFFAELVGLRADKAATSLSDMAKTGDFDKLVDGLKNVDGYAHKVAGLRLDDTTGSWKLLGSTVEVLEKRLFDLESGPLRGVVDRTNQWLQANQGLIVQRVQDTIAKIADNLPAIEKWGVRIAEGTVGYAAFAAAVKVVSVAVEGARIASVAATFSFKTLQAGARGAAAATVWLRNTTIASTIASGASTAATWLKTTALTAYNAVTATGSSLLGINTAATEASTIATGQSTVAVGASAAALVEKNAVQVAATAETVAGTTALAGYTTATEAATAATVGAEAALAPVVVTVGALTAALGALAAVWYNVNQLGKETEGLGFFGTVGEMIKQGTFDPAKAVDTYQNQQAEARRASADRGEDVPRASGGEDYDRGMSVPDGAYGELTVKAPPGVVQVTKKPKAGYRVNLNPSGTP